METLIPILFYTVALVLIISSIGVILSPKIIYSVLCAFIMFVSVGFVFFMLNAPFNAVSQIAIYGVAVSIIFAFAVMMTPPKKERKIYISFSPRSLLALFGSALIFGAIVIFMAEDSKIGSSDAFYAKNIPTLFDSTFEIAKGIFTNYVFAFELLSVFLLVAVIGAGVVIAKKKSEEA